MQGIIIVQVASSDQGRHFAAFLKLKTVTIFSESGLAEPFQYNSTLYVTFHLKENNLGCFCSSVLYTIAPVM